MHPGLSKLIEHCWDEDPDKRPVFAEIIIQLEDILQEIQVEVEIQVAFKLSSLQTTSFHLSIFFLQVPKGGHRRSRAKMQKK